MGPCEGNRAAMGQTKQCWDWPSGDGGGRGSLGTKRTDKNNGRKFKQWDPF